MAVGLVLQRESARHVRSVDQPPVPDSPVEVCDSFVDLRYCRRHGDNLTSDIVNAAATVSPNHRKQVHEMLRVDCAAVVASLVPDDVPVVGYQQALISRLPGFQCFPGSGPCRRDACHSAEAGDGQGLQKASAKDIRAVGHFLNLQSVVAAMEADARCGADPLGCLGRPHPPLGAATLPGSGRLAERQLTLDAWSNLTPSAASCNSRTCHQCAAPVAQAVSHRGFTDTADPAAADCCMPAASNSFTRRRTSSSSATAAQAAAGITGSASDSGLVSRSPPSRSRQVA